MATIKEVRDELLKILNYEPVSDLEEVRFTGDTITLFTEEHKIHIIINPIIWNREKP